MDAQKLNSWFGVLANLGVLVGIVFLAIQVNEDSNATKTQILDSVAEGHNSLNLVLASDPQVAQAVVGGLQAPDDLSDSEAIQFASWIRAYINHVLRIQQLHERGLIPDWEWRLNVEQAATILSTPGGRRFRESNRREFDDWCKDHLCKEMEPFFSNEPKWSFSLGRQLSSAVDTRDRERP